MSRPYNYATRDELSALGKRLTQSMSIQAKTNAVSMSSPPIRCGMGTTGVALILGGSVNVTVTWSSPMPKDSYQVDASPATGLLGVATTSVVSMNAASVTVRVTATSAILNTSASFIVVAVCR